MSEFQVSWQSWTHSQSLTPKGFTCGYCGKEVGAQSGFAHQQDHSAKIYICPKCGLPTYFFNDNQHPGPLVGKNIKGLPEDIETVYREMRETIKDGCYTATILLGRKLIMHIAEESGAKKKQTFSEYITYLADNHHLPPNASNILEFMKKLGNQSNHQIKLGTKQDAERIVKFTEALLYFKYELSSEFAEEENTAQETEEQVA